MIMVKRTWAIAGQSWLKKKSFSSYPFIKSPPLVSLDHPEIWPCPIQSPTTPNPSPATIMDGKLVAEEIRSNIGIKVKQMKDCIGKVPGLAVILVGERQDSQSYVRNKITACEEAGIKIVLTKFPNHCTEDELFNTLSSFNKNPSIHGIIVQLPLPEHLNESRIIDAINLEKDVDGLHPVNMGNLALRNREPLTISCTPKGCIELLLRYNIEIMGKKAVVIGRSNIVGLPMSLLLQRHHATVSVVHAFTKQPEKIAREADILIVAAGVPELVRASWLKPGVVIVDVGTNPIEDSSEEYGYRLIGDVCYKEAVKVASAITPVPGGVGPMTVAMLLLNTLDSAKRAFNFT